MFTFKCVSLPGRELVARARVAARPQRRDLQPRGPGAGARARVSATHPAGSLPPCAHESGVGFLGFRERHGGIFSSDPNSVPAGTSRPRVPRGRGGDQALRL